MRGYERYCSHRRPHEKLAAWQVEVELTLQLYRLTDNFPSDERYGLSRQIRRAIASVPANLSEGAARSTTRDYHRFVVMGRASLSEVETHLEIARRRGYFDPYAHDDVYEGIMRLSALLRGLIRALRAKIDAP